MTSEGVYIREQINLFSPASMKPRFSLLTSTVDLSPSSSMPSHRRIAVSAITPLLQNGSGNSHCFT